MNRMLTEMAKTIMLDAGLPKCWWVYAIQTRLQLLMVVKQERFVIQKSRSADSATGIHI